MIVRESIENALRDGPWLPKRFAALVYWLSQEDWVQLCLDLREPVCEVDISRCPVLMELLAEAEWSPVP